MAENSYNEFKPHTLVAQKIADEVVFDVSRVKESIFLKSDLTDSPLRFLLRILWKIPV